MSWAGITFKIVKARGQADIAIVFNELSALMGSSTICRFNCTYQQTYGLIRDRQVPAGRTDTTFNVKEIAPS